MNVKKIEIKIIKEIKVGTSRFRLISDGEKHAIMYYHSHIDEWRILYRETKRHNIKKLWNDFVNLGKKYK
jgi:hypothetical protein